MRELERLLTRDIFSLGPFSQALAFSIIQSVSAFSMVVIKLSGQFSSESLFWMAFALILNALLDISERLKKYTLKEGEVCYEQMDLWEEQSVMTTLLFKVMVLYHSYIKSLL